MMRLVVRVIQIVALLGMVAALISGLLDAIYGDPLTILFGSPPSLGPIPAAPFARWCRRLSDPVVMGVAKLLPSATLFILCEIALRLHQTEHV